MLINVKILDNTGNYNSITIATMILNWLTKYKTIHGWTWMGPGRALPLNICMGRQEAP